MKGNKYSDQKRIDSIIRFLFQCAIFSREPFCLTIEFHSSIFPQNRYFWKKSEVFIFALKLGYLHHLSFFLQIHNVNLQFQKLLCIGIS